MISSERIRIHSVETLSSNWAVLKKTTFDYLRRDGTWQTQNRETYDRGNGAAILLYNKRCGSVLLIRQFRYPALVNGHADGMLIEVCGGLLDQDSPETCIKREAEEEIGFRVTNPKKVFESYMSPGSVTERVFFFVAEYDHDARLSAGGGYHAEGEDIEVLELPFQHTLAMIDNGEIVDGKTIMLLQYAKIHGLFD